MQLYFQGQLKVTLQEQTCEQLQAQLRILIEILDYMIHMS